jgi:hypothetical protein
MTFARVIQQHQQEQDAGGHVAEIFKPVPQQHLIDVGLTQFKGVGH